MDYRQATPADLETLLAFPSDPPSGIAVIGPDRFREELAANRLRLPWAWLALDGGTVVGRALWWGRADSTGPLNLDCLHVAETVTSPTVQQGDAAVAQPVGSPTVSPRVGGVRPGVNGVPDPGAGAVPDRARVAAELLRHAHEAFGAQPPYTIVLPPTWRDDEAVAAEVAWRVGAAAAAGLGQQIERLRFEWSPGDGLPAPAERLRFRPGDEQEFLDVFEQAAVGSLDVLTQRELAVRSPSAQARDDYDFYRDCPGERDWWRIATTQDGTVAGFAVPSATPYSPNVGYLGMLPAFRGRGLVDDLMAEITRGHAGRGAERITATTDVLNAPMAAAFRRAGYRETERRLVLEAATTA